MNAQADVDVVTDYENLPNTFVKVKKEKALLALVNEADVESVTENDVVTMEAMDAESPGLVRQAQAASAGYRGASTYVGVLDTGLNFAHADFGSCTANFTPATTCRAAAYELNTNVNDGVLDDDGHGTNVSGIVAGIAPGTKVISLDVFQKVWNSAEGQYAQSAFDNVVLDGMNTLINWRNGGTNIVVANLSLGSGTFAGACSDTYGFNAARAAGILPVVAAGNNTSTAGIASPACIPAALSVGAVYDSSFGGIVFKACSDATTAANKVTCFSQSGPNLKMLAPGSQIDAAGITQSGTSQASPHVAGAAAVLKGAKSTATVVQVESALVNNGLSIIDRDGRTRKRLDVYSAVTALVGSAAADTTAPVVATPAQTPVLQSQLTTGTVFRISWSATDASGINAYDLYSSTNGGTWTREALSAGTATSKDFLLTAGNRYQFQVAAQDKAGNWSTWEVGSSFLVDNYTEAATSISYSSGWIRQAWASAMNGYVNVTATANASATFTFTGRSIAWVATKGTNRGQARVYLDGVLQTNTWDLYSATTMAKTVVLTANFATSGTHTLKIVNVATSGRPNIDIDSFIVAT